MRVLSFILVVLLLSGCSKEEINIVSGDWTKLIYETSDVGVVNVNNASRITVAFQSSFFDVLSGNGTLTNSPKEILDGYDLVSGQSVTALINDGKFMFGGVDNSEFIPVYRIKLMDDQTDALSFSHDNIERAIFLQGRVTGGNPESFFGILQSSFSQSTGGLSTDISIVLYTDDLRRLDTLSTQTITVSNLLLDQNSGIDGFIDGDQIFFTVQSQLFRYDLDTQTFISIEIGSTLKSVFIIGDQVVVQTNGLNFQIFDKDLVKQDDIGSQDLIEDDGNAKNTLLDIFTKGNQIFLVTGVSELEQGNTNFVTEVGVSIDLRVLDANWNEVNQFTILDGIDRDAELLWEQFEYVSGDVRPGTGGFGTFLFQKSAANSKFEYLLKKVSF